LLFKKLGLRAIAKQQKKTTISSFKAVQTGKRLLPLDGFSWKFTVETSAEREREKKKSIYSEFG